ncbi:hypothetical protein [Lutibacter sp.]|uniref:hypothetical protein n=1 Tax=Lutibacter sp. TaxID=1925666 RepID=UPI0025BB2F06|nr:hypothetical protein [Lutibacter sp.]MCF6167948.1 hypothetical protein [Lutibacter sp.]
MLTIKVNAQEEKKEEFKPVYITVTTAHRSSDPDVDYSDWLKTEQEYFDKVTMKNDLIIGSGYYFHYFTSDDSEVKLVSVYKTWEDIEKSSKVTNDLINEGWPDEDERKAFFDKQNSYYSPMHSDEIYASLPFQKDYTTQSKEPMIFYVKVNKQGDGGKGFKEYFENVTQKNTYIKGYYTHRHRWGANSRDAVEVFALESLSDIEKMFEENSKLVKEHWSDEGKRKEFFKEYNKIFSGHGDYILTNVPELAK